MKIIHRDEAFICQNCHKSVPKRGGGYSRDHCMYCLYGLHVDERLPGDRKSECHGLMKPTDIIYNTMKKTQQIVYICEKCHHRFPVMVAKDDDKELFFKLMQHSAIEKMLDI